MSNRKVVYMATLPTCDVCKFDDNVEGVEAVVDAATFRGPWAYMCRKHWHSHGVGTPTWLEAGEAPERTDDDIRRDAQAALEAGDYEAFEDAIGDRDPIEFL